MAEVDVPESGSSSPLATVSAAPSASESQRARAERELDADGTAADVQGSGSGSMSLLSSIPSTNAGIGDRRFFTFEEQSLTDRLSARVNVASGNLLLTANDLSIAGTGMDTGMARFYNSLTTDADPNGFGPGWSTGSAPTVRLEFPASGQVRYVGPSGYRVLFVYNATTGDYERTGAGIDATLRPAGSGWLLEWHSKLAQFFDANGRLTVEEAKQRDNQVFYTYGTNGSLTQVNDTQGRLIQFGYNAQGLISTITDAAGERVFSYTYAQFAGDPTYRLATSKLDSYGLEDDLVNEDAVTAYDYDADGRLTKVTNARGDVTEIGYEAGTRRVASVKRVTASTTVADPTTGFTYYANTTGCGTDGTPVARTIVDGARTDVTDTTTYCHDTHQRVVATFDANGHKRATTYTSNSEVFSFNDSGGTGLPFLNEWNADDNLIEVKLPTGGETTAQYQDTSNPHFPTSVRDFSRDGATDGAKTWEYTYDPYGNLIQATNPDVPGGAVTYRYCYNYFGLLQRIDAPPVTVPLDTSTSAGCGTANQGNDTLFTYDGDGNLTVVDPPGSHGTQTFTYDAVSRVATMTDGRGVTASYSYDGYDHVTDVDYDDGAASFPGAAAIDYAWDAAGNQLSIEQTTSAGGVGDTTFDYDELNRQIQISTDVPNWETEYTYDTAGNLTEVDGSDEPDVFYTYNKLNQVTTVQDQKGRTTTFGYDTRGNRTSTAYPNGVTQRATTDVSGRLACVYAHTGTAPTVGTNGCPTPSTSLLTYFGYDYARPGSGVDTMTRYSETDRNGHVTAYTYDQIERLTRARTTTAAGGSGTETRDYEYTLDPSGNITAKTVTGTTVTNETLTLAYNDANELCWTKTTTSSPPSPVCGTVPSGATNYGYDNAGNLTSTSGTGGGLSAGYTLAGQTATITPPGGSAFAMHYAGATSDDRRIAGTMQFSTNGLGLAAQGTASTAQHSDWFVRDPGGALIGMMNRASASNDLYYLVDGLGSIAATTNTSGTVVTRYTYDPYGQQLSPNPAAVDGSGNPTDRNPFRYASGYYDTKTGMLKFGTRYYLPTLMRWTQPDPIAGKPSNPMTLNAYGYVGCDPVNLVDQSGRDWRDLLEFYGYLGACYGGAQTATAMGAGTPVIYNPWGAVLVPSGGCIAGMFGLKLTGIDFGSLLP